jgi:hypothetical protein
MTAARSPHVRVSEFLMPKEDMSLEECEDAVGVSLSALRFAVADGATEAFDSRSWARSLAEGWAGGDVNGKASAPVGVEEFGRWVVSVGARLHESWEGRELPWYAEEKARGGSYAAFVGLCFESDGERLGWRAVALGDACLVWRRGGRILSAMPLSVGGRFNSSPPLVPSRASLLGAALERAVTGAGAALEGDTFLLLTDAAAQWFFAQHEAGRPALAEFDSLLARRDNDALAELLRGERRAGRMADDDVAILLIAVGAED